MAWHIFLRPRRAKREIATLRERLQAALKANEEAQELLRLNQDYIARLEDENRSMSERIDANKRGLAEQRKTIDSMTIELNRLQRIDKTAERLREENKTLTERVATMRGENRSLTKRTERMMELLQGRIGGKKAEGTIIHLSEDEGSDLVDDSEDWLLPFPGPRH